MEPVVVLTSAADLDALAVRSPRAAAAAREYFDDAPPGRAVVVTWKGTGKRRSYQIQLAMTADAFAQRPSMFQSHDLNHTCGAFSGSCGACDKGSGSG